MKNPRETCIASAYTKASCKKHLHTGKVRNPQETPNTFSGWSLEGASRIKLKKGLSPSRKTSEKDFIEKIDIEAVLRNTYRNSFNPTGFYQKLRLDSGKGQTSKEVSLKGMVEKNIFIKASRGSGQDYSEKSEKKAPNSEIFS